MKGEFHSDTPVVQAAVTQLSKNIPIQKLVDLNG